MNDASTCFELQAILSRSSVRKISSPNQEIQLEQYPDKWNNTLFCELNRFRMTGTLCNGVLATDEDQASFRIHKIVLSLCSNYFRALFTTSLVGKNSGDGKNSRILYRIPGISSTALETIIKFAYSGMVDLDVDNVTELIPVADQLAVMGVVNAGIDFLLDNISVENCIGMWRFGKEYFLQRLEKEARKFILAHFDDIVYTQEFLDLLEKNSLKSILEDDALNIPNEIFVWTAIKHWCQHNPRERQNCIPYLFSSMRLALLAINDLKQIMDDPRVFRHAQCRNHINLITSYIFNQLHDLSKYSEDNTIISFFTPRHPFEVIFTAGGWTVTGPTNILEVYDFRADLWKIIFSDTLGPRAYHQTLCLGDFIYIIGGSTGQDHLNSCWRFSIANLALEEIAPMHERRCFLSATVLDNKIYAMGGFDGQERLKTVEYYDMDQNQWIYVSPMNEKRSDASASALRNRIFVAGGYNGLDFLQSAECYFSDFDQWCLLSSMVHCRSGLGCVALDNAVYAIGGYDGENRLKTVEKYCLFQSQWFATKPMKQPRSNFATALLDKKIYVMGGYDDIADDTTDKAECFDPEHPGWRSISSLNVGRSGFSACTFSDISRIKPFIKNDRFRCLLKNIFTEESADLESIQSDDIV